MWSCLAGPLLSLGRRSRPDPVSVLPARPLLTDVDQGGDKSRAVLFEVRTTSEDTRDPKPGQSRKTEAKGGPLGSHAPGARAAGMLTRDAT
jgi:hypothetical protein